MAINVWDNVTGIFSSQMISTGLISTPHPSLEFDWPGKIASMTVFCTDRMEYYSISFDSTAFINRAHAT
jgi:hypothetical protein